MNETTYNDGAIECGHSSLTIRWYYAWGPKTTPYDAIIAINQRPLTRWRGKWRIWGSTDLVRWYNLDLNRPNKDVALEIDTGRRVRPTITPDDPDAVLRVVRANIA